MKLAPAAGAWGPLREDVPEPGDAETEWITWEDAPHFTKDMFVARVRGRSMEPVITDGAACLFRRVDAPSPERAVLVRHGGTTDPETGGAFTVKRYRNAGGRVMLEPVNADFAPLVVNDGDDVRVIAEVVKVIG